MERLTIHLNRFTERDGRQSEYFVLRGIKPVFLDGIMVTEPVTARSEEELCWKVPALAKYSPEGKFVSRIPYSNDPALPYLRTEYKDGCVNEYFRLEPHQIPEAIKPYVEFQQ